MIRKILPILLSGRRANNAAWYLILNGATTKMYAPAHASINDLHAGAFTAEGWFLSESIPSGSAEILSKGVATSASPLGWDIKYYNGTHLFAAVDCTTTDSSVLYANSSLHNDGLWHHIAMTWDNNGDRKVRIYVDRVLRGTGGAGVGAVRSDAAIPLGIGSYAGSSSLFDGNIGWVRISNCVRNITAETYTRATPPPMDANTVRLWKMNDGFGSAPADYSANAQPATVAYGVWLRDGWGYLSDVFVGGSITAAATGYCPLTHTWLPTQRTGFALTNTINAGVGGTSGWYALCRMTADVVAYNPDVVVMDWIANDSFTAFYQRSGEALIRRLVTELPNVQLVFMGFTGIANKDIDDATNIRASVTANWQALCSHYGIPYIDYAAELYRRVNGNGEHLNVYMLDGLHPTQAGHQLAHELVRSTVLSKLISNATITLPDRLYDCADFEATPIARNASSHDGVTGTWTPSGGDIASSEANATITFTDTFVGCGILVPQNAGQGVIQYSIDGGAYSASLDLTLVGIGFEMITTILSRTPHTLTIKIISGTVTLRKFLAI